jgi:hypothetical protein
MGILNRALALLLLAPALAGANVFAPVSGIEASLKGGVGPGRIGEGGTTFTVRFGDDDDKSNRSGDLHLSYDDQLTPSDSTNVDSDIKHIHSWSGGFLVSPWKGGSVGVELDSTSDYSLNLYSDGVKATIGQEPFKLSYRFARSTLRTQINLGTPKNPVLREGAGIYQQTLELEDEIKLEKGSRLTLTGAASLFHPDVNQFADLLNGAQLPNGVQVFQGFSSFQDTLENFQRWAFGANWKYDLPDGWDSTVSATLSNIVISANPLVETQLALGYEFSEAVHVQGEWDYTHDPQTHSSLYTLEFRYTWDRPGPDDRGPGKEKR